MLEFESLDRILSLSARMTHVRTDWLLNHEDLLEVPTVLPGMWQKRFEASRRA